MEAKSKIQNLSSNSADKDQRIEKIKVLEETKSIYEKYRKKADDLIKDVSILNRKKSIASLYSMNNKISTEKEELSLSHQVSNDSNSKDSLGTG